MTKLMVVARDLLAGAGAALIIAGVAAIYAPAGMIVAGAMLVGGAAAWSRAA